MGVDVCVMDISATDTYKRGNGMPTGNHVDQLPLRPPVLHILLSLSSGAMHGLGIADAVEAGSNGVVQLGPGTLYRSLDDMRGCGLVDLSEAPLGTDTRRKYYAISARGRELLGAELGRLQQLLELAGARGALSDGQA